MSNKQSIGDRIRNKRLSMSLTIAKLSDRTGLATGHLSEIENGLTVNLQAQTLRKLAKGLEMSIVELLGEDDTDA